MKTEARHAERERIARDLHDSLLQGIQAIQMRLQTWADDTHLPARHRSEVDAVADQARAIVVDARERILSLRRGEKHEGEIITRLQCLTQSGQGMPAPHYSVDVRGSPRGLTPETYDTVLEIAGEAVRNAYLHAQAGRITLTLEYHKRGLSLTISDDGKGIETVSDDHGVDDGHFGLIGMRERAVQLGARFVMEANDPRGCRIQLHVQSALAFTRAR